MLPAFLSSINSTFTLIRSMLPTITDTEEVSCYVTARRLWTSVYGENMLPADPMFQREWDEIHCKKVLDNMVFENDQDRASFLASTQKESNAWLQALPSRSVGTLLDNNTFLCLLPLRSIQVSSPSLLLQG
uniref:Uncharacterized protein n=1 Tax=Cacopsylla melanoneura TaxID=428564 RepID=A0A8D9ACE0_9HEMI